jgi:hypothetical protein
MSFNARPVIPCAQSARRTVGGCIRISACNQDVSEHRMNKVIIVPIVNWEYQWLQVQI